LPEPLSEIAQVAVRSPQRFLVDFEMVVFRMYRTSFVFAKCTIQGGPKVDVLLIAFLRLWLKFWVGIDKYWIVPVRKLFYFHHW